MRKKWVKLVISCLSVLFLFGASNVNAQKVELAKQKVGDVFKTDGGKFEVIKKTDIDETKETGPFKVKVNYISALSFEPTKEMASFVETNENGLVHLIAVHMTIENTTDETLAIYPNQSVLIANKKQVDSDLFLSADIGGDFYGNVEKEGIVFYVYDGDLADVEDMKVIVKPPHGPTYESIGDAIEFELKFEDKE